MERWREGYDRRRSGWWMAGMDMDRNVAAFVERVSKGRKRGIVGREGFF